MDDIMFLKCIVALNTFLLCFWIHKVERINKDLNKVYDHIIGVYTVIDKLVDKLRGRHHE